LQANSNHTKRGAMRDSGFHWRGGYGILLAKEMTLGDANLHIIMVVLLLMANLCDEHGS